MAAFEDRTGPDLDQYVGHKWADWLSAVQSSEPKQQSSSDGGSTSKRDVEVARLRRTDMALFGFRPATDRFFLVVCEHCGQLVKPQSLHIHYEKKHKSKRLTKMISPSSSRSKTSHGQVKHSSKNNHFIGPSSGVSKHSGYGSSSTHQKSSHAVRHPGTSDRPKVPVKTETGPSHKASSSAEVDKTFTEPGPRHLRPEKAGIKLIPSQPAKVHTSKQDIASNVKLGRSPSQSKVSNKTNSTFQESELSDVQSLKLSSHHSNDAKHRHYHKAQKNGGSSSKTQTSESHAMERRTNERYNAQSLPSSNKNKRVYHTYHHHHPPQSASSDGSDVLHETSDLRLVEQRLPQGIPLVMLEKTPMPGVRGTVKVGHHTSEARKRSRDTDCVADSPPPRPKVPFLHNPQRDKNSDTGHPLPNSILPSKPKKEKRNIPLKAREYDPNRHCGVWLTEDNARCTRSLTCKVHPLSAKRGVPGRRKMFDELVQERNYEKQKLKEKKLEAAASTSSSPTASVLSPPTKSGGEFAVPSPPPVAGSHRLRSDSSTSNVSSSNQHSATKTKSLFPKNFAAWHVDCWDDFDDMMEDSNKNSISYPCVHRHPQPFAVCQFSARRVGTCQVSYSRKLERQLESLTSNIQKFGMKAPKAPKPFSFTPIATATFREPAPKVPERLLTAVTPFYDQNVSTSSRFRNGSDFKPQFNAQKPGRTVSGPVPDNLHKRGVPDHAQDGLNVSKSSRTNMQRKSSTPLLKEQFHDASAKTPAVDAGVRIRSKSEQAINLVRRTASGAGAAWSSHPVEPSMSTSPHFFINDTNANNSSPSSFSPSPSIVQHTSNDTSSEIMQTVAPSRPKSKKLSEKQKSMIARSPKSSSYKAGSKSAIAKYAVSQGLVNSIPTELLDSGQITVQRPNGLNSVSTNMLLKPGAHSVTLSGNIGALTVPGEDSGNQNAFAENRISKRLKNMNSNNNFASQVEASTHQLAYNATSPKSNLFLTQQQALTQAVGVMPENLILQNDETYLISPPYGQDGGNGTKAIVLDQHAAAHTNFIDTANLDPEQSQSNPPTDVFRLVCGPGEAPINCEMIRGKFDDKRNIQLNVADMAQLDQSILGNVFTNASKSGQQLGNAHLVATDTSNFDMLPSDLSSCSSGKTNRTSDISQSFITQ